MSYTAEMSFIVDCVEYVYRNDTKTWEVKSYMTCFKVDLQYYCIEYRNPELRILYVSFKKSIHLFMKRGRENNIGSANKNKK